MSEKCALRLTERHGFGKVGSLSGACRRGTGSVAHCASGSARSARGPVHGPVRGLLASVNRRKHTLSHCAKSGGAHLRLRLLSFSRAWLPVFSRKVRCIGASSRCRLVQLVEGAGGPVSGMSWIAGFA